MITRAISLLIIIGDHKTLNIDPNWQKLIERCNSNGALMQGDKVLHPRIKVP